MSSAEHASRAYVNEFFTLRFDSTSPSSGKQRSREREGEEEEKAKAKRMSSFQRRSRPISKTFDR